MDHLLCDEE